MCSTYFYLISPDFDNVKIQGCAETWIGKTETCRISGNFDEQLFHTSYLFYFYKIKTKIQTTNFLSPFKNKIKETLILRVAGYDYN